MIDFDSFRAITFDCYGTLVDWERGILAALGDLLGDAATAERPERLLEHFGRFESAAQSGPFRPYRTVLAEVARAFGAEHGVALEEAAVAGFAASVADWPVFDDTVDALRVLEQRCRLAIVSNVDDDLFAGTAARLGVHFAEVVTAQQVRSYKPAPTHFHEALRRLGLPRERVLHVAQSVFHDIAPARALGFTTVWVNRRAGRSGAGATPPGRAVPDLEVPDLASLARLVRGRNSA